MDAALIVSGVLLSLAGSPHCAAMCGPACAAATCSGSGAQAQAAGWAFHGARAAGYALVGALASAGTGAATLSASVAPGLRPLWVLLHCAAAGLGLWMAVTGRQPAWMMQRIASRPGAPAPCTEGWRPLRVQRQGWAAGAAGAAWVAWPCGLQQSAAVVAALTHTPVAGALAMGGFALASTPGLLITPWLLRWVGRGGPRRAGWGDGLVRAAIRLSGLALAGGALVALNRDAWHRFVAYCST